jgi:beta-glucosidase
MNLIFKTFPVLMLMCGVVCGQTAAPATRPASRPAPRPRTASDAVTPATRPVSPRQWMARHEGFLRQTQENPSPQLVFIGDSITDFWPRRGKESWDKLLGEYKILNLGISGDRTELVLWRITNGELDGIRPKVVVIMIGTNNIGHFDDEKPEWAAAGVTRIVQTVREKQPQAKVLLLGIFPRDGKDHARRQKVAAVNHILAKLDDGQHVFFLDITQKFLGPDGELPSEIMPDKLHPATQGYNIWYESMHAKLQELMK